MLMFIFIAHPIWVPIQTCNKIGGFFMIGDGEEEGVMLLLWSIFTARPRLYFFHFTLFYYLLVLEEVEEGMEYHWNGMECGCLEGDE
jgi:hypothetical protein